MSGRWRWSDDMIEIFDSTDLWAGPHRFYNLARCLQICEYCLCRCILGGLMILCKCIRMQGQLTKGHSCPTEFLCLPQVPACSTVLWSVYMIPLFHLLQIHESSHPLIWDSIFLSLLGEQPGGFCPCDPSFLVLGRSFLICAVCHVSFHYPWAFQWLSECLPFLDRRPEIEGFVCVNQWGQSKHVIFLSVPKTLFCENSSNLSERTLSRTCSHSLPTSLEIGLGCVWGMGASNWYSSLQRLLRARKLWTQKKSLLRKVGLCFLLMHKTVFSQCGLVCWTVVGQPEKGYQEA